MRLRVVTLHSQGHRRRRSPLSTGRMSTFCRRSTRPGATSGIGPGHAPLLHGRSGRRAGNALDMKHVRLGPSIAFAWAATARHLYRFPLTDSARIDLTIGKRNRAAWCKRRAHPSWSTVPQRVVFNLHLAVGRRRATQLERFLTVTRLRTYSGHSALVAETSTRVGIAGQALPRACRLGTRREACTDVSSSLPLRPLDGLWVRAPVGLSGAPGTDQSFAGASDHLPSSPSSRWRRCRTNRPRQVGVRSRLSRGRRRAF